MRRARIIARMVLRIDPRYPLVWRSPSDLQFGVDHAQVVLTDVSSAQERVLAALLGGISRSGLEMTATDAELDDLDGMLDLLRPVLIAPHPSRAMSVVVEGDGETAGLVRARLREAGIRSPTDGGNDRPDLAIQVAHFVLAPEQHGRWLRRDVPHLPVLFGDQRVHIGPLIEPGDGPCLYCLERHRTDADPAWPAIASQLWGRTADTATSLIAGEVAALVVRTVLQRLSGVPVPDELALDTATGDRFTRQWWPHPGCGCVGLVVDAEDSATAVRRGSGSASARPRDPIRSGPRRGGVGAVRA